LNSAQPAVAVKKRKNRTKPASAALIGEENYEQELKEIVESRRRACHQRFLFTSKYCVPIFLAISIGMFNQLSGINAILYYLNAIFEHAGFQ